MIDQRTFHETVSLARELIRIPSHNPPGDEAVIASFAAAWLEKRGMDVKRVRLEPGRDSLVARIAGRGSGSIVLCGHLDTVIATPDAWTRAPLSAEIADERLWGLGAADMKSGVAVLMQSVARQAAKSTLPRCDVVLALTADEEWGYRGAKSIAQSGLIDDALCVVIAEPTSNTPYFGQKGELWIRAEFVGREAHGSSPSQGANSILPAARFAWRLDEGVRALPAVDGAGKTSVNVGKVRGGRQVNIVPQRTTVEIDVRCAAIAHRDIVLAETLRIGQEEAVASGCSFSYETMNDHPPIVSDPRHPEAIRFHAAAQSVGTGFDKPSVVPYSTDGVSIHPTLGVPVFVCGPGDIAHAHQPDESISLSDIRTALELYAAYLEG